ncbi:CocE/NonD family hydrolase [Acidobacteriota bacterium]
MKKLATFSFILLFFLGLVFLLADENREDEDVKIEIQIDQKIPLSDGIHLTANIWKPRKMETPLPAIVAYSSYGINGMHEDGVFFAKRGYVFLAVNCRGRNGSEGEFFPYEDAGRDGYDVMAWIAKQPWSDGQVGMMGLSYGAFTQWQTLKYLPPALKTIIPSAPTYPGYNSPYANNILMSNRIRWSAVVSGTESNMNIYRDNDYWTDLFYQRYEQHIPFAKFAEFAKGNQQWWDNWVAHPDYDDYWKSLIPTAEEYKGIEIPILQISGHFDGSLRSTISYFQDHMKFGNEEAKKKHYLIIGPWSHGGTRRNHSEMDGLKFGPNSILYKDMIDFYLLWFDWVLKGKEKAEFLKKQVSYYVMNEDEWRYVDRLEEISNATETYYLSSEGGKANDVFYSGRLERNALTAEQRPDVFEYDPLKLIERIKPVNDLRVSGLLDQSAAFAEDKLVYHSEPFAEDVEIAGVPVFNAYIELNVPDTDFEWKLFEITRQGVSISLGQGIMRARYRNSFSIPELVTPGEVVHYEMPLYYMLVRKITKGSRLRLVFNCVNSPHMQKNYNSGGDVSYETAKDARTAIVKLYHDKRYPSALVFPVKR